MSEEPSLVGWEEGRGRPAAGRARPDGGEATPAVDSTDPGAPLAVRMRPTSLDEFVGQAKLVGPGAPLRELIERDRIPSLILWGPPGCGKTSLAHVVALVTRSAFVRFSAVTEGIARVRAVIAEAAERRRATGRGTILFVDEIHRFNKAQQDAFLPHVEAGTVVLIGATTENPSFEVIGPLLSRTRVFVLEPLSAQELAEVCRRALREERGLAESCLEIEEEALERLAVAADGDARRALNALETAAELARGKRIVLADVEKALQHRFARYDKGGEEHYNVISALHKAVRGSDPDGALYWLARMLEAGEDPMYIARRLVRMATEDIGLADPQALAICIGARDAYHFLGSPEGDLALAEATIYLAAAPKSNRVYEGFSRARRAARETPAEPVPIHLRNAPTALMKELGYGRDYVYDPLEPGGVAPQTYLPDSLVGQVFYEAGDRGHEAEVAARLRRFAEMRSRARGTGMPGTGMTSS